MQFITCKTCTAQWLLCTSFQESGDIIPEAHVARSNSEWTKTIPKINVITRASWQTVGCSLPAKRPFLSPHPLQMCPIFPTCSFLCSFFTRRHECARAPLPQQEEKRTKKLQELWLRTKEKRSPRFSFLQFVDEWKTQTFAAQSVVGKSLLGRLFLAQQEANFHFERVAKGGLFVSVCDCVESWWM